MNKLLTLLSILLATLVSAQDTIVRRDSARIVAKVTTIDQKKISYQRYGHPDGPSYEISRGDVARIIYADGSTEKINKHSESIPVLTKKNIASVTITDAVSGMLTINYERIFWGDIGVRLSASRGLLAAQKSPGGYYYSPNSYYSRFKPLSLSLDIHYYAAHNHAFSYYIGAAMEYGQTKQSYYWGCFPPFPSEPTITEYYMAGITNGISFRTNAPISLDLYSTVGAKRDSGSDYLNPALRVGFNVGYRF